MNGVMGHIGEEWAGLILLDEGKGGARQRVDPFWIFRFITSYIWVGSAGIKVDIEALRFRCCTVFAAEVPFAEDARRIPGGFQRLGHRYIRWREAALVRNGNHPHQVLRPALGAFYCI